MKKVKCINNSIYSNMQSIMYSIGRMIATKEKCSTIDAITSILIVYYIDNYGEDEFIKKILEKIERLKKLVETKTNNAEDIKPMEKIDASVIEINCPYCGSGNIEKIGIKSNKIKIYQCISCSKKFTNVMNDALDPDIRKEIIELWIEKNKPYDKIAEIIKLHNDKEIKEEMVEKIIDDFLIENLKDMPQKQREIILRRLIFKYNDLSVNEIAKTLKEKYGCKILLRTIIDRLREKAVIDKYWDIIKSMAKNGHTAKDISHWLEKGKGIFIDPAFLEDDLKRMGVKNEMLNM